MLTRGRLALLLLPLDPEATAQGARDAWDRLRAEGRLAEDGSPGPRPLVEGGFRVARLEAHDRAFFLANRQGGFRVCCPTTRANVVPIFNPALEAWRAGGPATLACACGAEHPLASLRYAPEAGFARGWITIEDAESATVEAEALALVERATGGVRIVLRRG